MNKELIMQKNQLEAILEKTTQEITKEDIKKFFPGDALNEEQFGLVCEYLVSQKIKVDGYEPAQKTPESAQKTVKEDAERASASNPETEKQEENSEAQDGEGPDFLGMYLEELAEIEKLSETEEERLFFEAVNGDSMAKSTLAGQYLETVYELAMTYVASELPIEDLVQEGNIGLLLALENLEAKPNLEEYRKQVFDGIRKAMEEAVEMSQDKKDLDDEIVGRVNHLNESILSLEEDLGHKVSKSELSAYLEMPLEEIKDVLRMAGDEMKDKSDVR